MGLFVSERTKDEHSSGNGEEMVGNRICAYSKARVPGGGDAIVDRVNIMLASQTHLSGVYYLDEAQLSGKSHYLGIK